MGKSCLINKVVENISRSSKDPITLHRQSNSQRWGLAASQRNILGNWGIWNCKDVRTVTVGQTESPCSPLPGLDSNLQPMFKEVQEHGTSSVTFLPCIFWQPAIKVFQSLQKGLIPTPPGFQKPGIPRASGPHCILQLPTLLSSIYYQVANLAAGDEALGPLSCLLCAFCNFVPHLR